MGETGRGTNHPPPPGIPTSRGTGKFILLVNVLVSRGPTFNVHVDQEANQVPQSKKAQWLKNYITYLKSFAELSEGEDFNKETFKR